MTHRSGFTLVELLITVAITIILTTVGAISLVRYRASHGVKLVIQEVSSAVAATRHRAVSQEGGTAWGVRFNNAENNQQYEIVSGSSYASGTVKQSAQIAQGVQFSNPATGTLDLWFSQLSGLTTQQIISFVNGTGDGMVGDVVVKSSGTVTDRLDTGLGGYWHFDEAAGMIAYDASGNDNTATTTAVFSWGSGAACKAGTCITFDGTGKSFTAADSPSIDPGLGNFSVSLWLKLDASTGMRAINKWPSAGIGWMMDVNSTTGGAALAGGVRFQIRDGTTSIDYGAAGGLNDGKWHLVTATIERGSATGFRLYVDGNAIGTPQDLTTVAGSISYAAPIAFGRMMHSSSGYFRGSIDEVRYYHRVLSPEEIMTQYNVLK